MTTKTRYEQLIYDVEFITGTAYGGSTGDSHWSALVMAATRIPTGLIEALQQESTTEPSDWAIQLEEDGLIFREQINGTWYWVIAQG